MQAKKQQESSATGSMIGFQQGKKFPLVKKKLLNKVSKPYRLEDLMARSVLKEDDQIDDVVRKRGSLWVLFDDETGAEISGFKKRKDAWAKQKLHRNMTKSQKKIKKREEEAREKKQQLTQAPPTVKPREPVEVGPKAKKESLE